MSLLGVISCRGGSTPPCPLLPKADIPWRGLDVSEPKADISAALAAYNSTLRRHDLHHLPV